MMNTLLEKYPREIAFPQRQFVANKEDFIRLVKSYNGKKNVYFSLYDCLPRSRYMWNGNNFTESKIDKVFFDLDSEDGSLDKPFEDLKRLIAYANAHKYKFCMCFSGKKGFHLYLFCRETRRKELLKNAHLYITKILNINLDRHIVGDIARISRMPNTWHLTGEKFCIPISIGDIEKGLEFIKEKAKKPNPEFCVYGEELIELEALPNIEKEMRNNGELPEFDYNAILNIDDKFIADFPPCVLSWLTTYSNASHRNRFYFALFCAHAGLTPGECNTLAKKYYNSMKERSGNRNRYQEFIAEKAIEYAYTKDFIIPSCHKLFDEKSCLGRCKYFKHGNFYLYKDNGKKEDEK